MKNLHNSTMLVQLEISIWQNQITDQKLTEEVAQKHDIKGTNDRYIKTLVDPRSLGAVRSAGTALRALHNHMTMPWNDGGVRILPSSLFFKYREKMEDARKAFDSATEEFVNDYPKLKEQARLSRKGTFDESDYPTIRPRRTSTTYSVCV